ncbi:MAG: pyroglutamyl-peptidase I [Muribaculaceae bacterium]|nr:pyroglutamyl-peptidase I [Muribaculaceae bacterium]
MRILISCFEPFGRDVVNSSRQAVDRLPDTIGQHIIQKVLLPVSFNRCSREMSEAICEFNPDMVIMTGQATREAICLERQAINRALSKGADTDGVIASGGRIISGAPDAIFTIFPVDIIASSLAGDTGQSIKVSNSAGTFVCNRLYFDVLHRYPTIPSLFVHLPITPAQAATRNVSTPSLPTQSAAMALQRLTLMLADIVL